jgi:hypothetical protein
MAQMVAVPAPAATIVQFDGNNRSPSGSRRVYLPERDGGAWVDLRAAGLMNSGFSVTLRAMELYARGLDNDTVWDVADLPWVFNRSASAACASTAGSRRQRPV